MRIDNLAQLIVPLILLAIWALTWLFNRDAQPIPPRSARAPGPNGGGPRQSPSNSPSRMNDGRVPASAQGGPTQRRNALGPDDEILILPQDPRRPQGATQPNRQASPPARRPGEGRPSPKDTKRTPEVQTPRRLSASMSHAHEAPAPPPQALKRLSLPPTLELKDQTVGALAGAGLLGPPPDRAGLDLHRLRNEPNGLRDSFILGDVLFRPPLSRRNGAFRFRGRRIP